MYSTPWSSIAWITISAPVISLVIGLLQSFFGPQATKKGRWGPGTHRFGRRWLQPPPAVRATTTIRILRSMDLTRHFLARAYRRAQRPTSSRIRAFRQAGA